MAIPDSARRVIDSGRLAHFVTLNRNGTPQMSCVWAGTDGDEIVMAHFRDHVKLKNIRRNPRVSLSIETQNVNPQGLTEYLVVHGTARVEDGGASELLQKLAFLYLGPDVGRFQPIPNPPPGYITRVTPIRFSGIGPWSGIRA